jgi:signal transduction histidine kinase
MNIFEQITELLSSGFGGMAYHFTVTFMLLILAYQIFRTYREQKSDEDKQLLSGVSGMLFVQVLVVSAAMAAKWDIQYFDSILPMVDRWGGFVISIGLVWLWSVPVKLKRTKISFVTVIFLSFISMEASSYWWIVNGTANGFETSNLYQFWNFATILFLVYGLVAVYRRKNLNYRMAVAMMLILLTGEVLQTVIYLGSSFTILTRLAQLISFPLIMGVLKSPSKVSDIPAIALGNEVVETIEEAVIEKLNLEPEPTLIPADIFSRTLKMIGEVDPKFIYAQLAEFISKSMVADICLLFSPPTNAESFFLYSGYDLILEGKISRTMIEYVLGEEMVTIFNQRKSLQIPTADAKKWERLSHKLNVSNIGSALLTPIMKNNSEPIGAIFLISPYSNRKWTTEDEEFLSSSNEYIANVLLRASTAGLKAQSDSIEDLALQSRIDELEKEIYQLPKGTLEEALPNDETIISRAYSPDDELLRQDLNRTQMLVKAQALELEAFQKQGVSPDENTNAIITLQAELDMAKEELNKLKTKMPASDIAPQIETPMKEEALEKQTQIINDIRQPVTTISGFTDLLLSESVGSLSAIQKKFLGRVKTSVGQISEMVSNLVQVTSEQAQKFQFKPQIIELMDIIDDVMQKTRVPFQKGNIVLRVNMPQILPPLFSHKDALEQLIINLLNHVRKTTDSGHEIFLNIGEDVFENKHSICIEIRGGDQLMDEDIESIFNSNHLSDQFPEIYSAKDLSELVGGKLEISNHETNETTFLVNLPTELAVLDMQVA